MDGKTILIDPMLGKIGVKKIVA
ncbi:hypothetical protein [Paenibacillus kribbensis]|nr:hypothetical protein [Paenibacillus kribbensis]